MKKKLKEKRYKKYALIVIALVLTLSFVKGFSLEGKDAKLPDGQGNIVTGNQYTDQEKDQLTAFLVAGSKIFRNFSAFSMHVK